MLKEIIMLNVHLIKILRLYNGAVVITDFIEPWNASKYLSVFSRSVVFSVENVYTSPPTNFNVLTGHLFIYLALYVATVFVFYSFVFYYEGVIFSTKYTRYILKVDTRRIYLYRLGSE